MIRQNININNYVNNPVYNISLGGHTSNPKGYELGNIASIEYHLDHMPDEKTLLNDLSSMKNLLIDTINKLNIYVDDENITYSVNGNKSTNSVIQVPTLKNLKYTPAEETPHTQLNVSNFDPSNTVKKDYVKETKRNSSTGEYGENIVVKLEEEKLKKAGKHKLAKQIVHVSVTQGDGAGYDIKSFDIDGNEIYIEVKSTTSPDRNAAFNISANEVKASEYYGDSYYLYRLYDISNTHEHPKYYTIQGNLKEKLNLLSTSYLASPK